MDVNTKRLNSKDNDSSSGEKINETRCRPRFSRSILSAIVTHIKSNPEPRIKPDLTSEVSSARQHSSGKQLVDQKPEEDVDLSTMKYKKSERGSDSSRLKETSGVAKRLVKRDFLKHSEAEVDLLNIPLPDKKPPGHQRISRDGEHSCSKNSFTRENAEQFMERMSTFPKRASDSFKVTVFSQDPSSCRTNKQCSVQSNEGSLLSTSSVDSCESSDSLPRQSVGHSKLLDDNIDESSPADDRATPDTIHTSSINEDCITKRFPLELGELPRSPSPPSEFHSYSREHEFYKGKKEASSNRRVLGLHHEDKLADTLQLPDTSIAPPGFEAPRGFPVTSHYETPRKERRSRFSAHASPLPYDSRSRLSNRVSGSPRYASPSHGSSGESIDSVTNWRLQQEPSHQMPYYQYSGSGGTGSNLYRNPYSKRSFESLLQESRHERTMTRAPSYDNVSIRSADSERPFLHHLSQE